ncbi:glycerate kinase [Roseomonas sp. CECT 9278]|uniref:glycerate kinase n=1 Tax=Roseomonas sp. CECT 9278 TaxID=2845823 RepID=UPI001E4BC40E|nr:glycerate kinase [Roseomonas sp. CECT 9278]CAH0227246.1 hypothetical protein ROS9278_02561 [Roseomonas sp. CECT 9278]
MSLVRTRLAPCGFKECRHADAVADVIAAKSLAACPSARVALRPVVDGGEGSSRARALAARGHVEHVTVSGPVGLPVLAQIGSRPAPWQGPR